MSEVHIARLNRIREANAPAARKRYLQLVRRVAAADPTLTDADLEALHMAQAAAGMKADQHHVDIAHLQQLAAAARENEQYETLSNQAIAFQRAVDDYRMQHAEVLNALAALEQNASKAKVHADAQKHVRKRYTQLMEARTDLNG